jgi:hypothetical protein
MGSWAKLCASSLLSDKHPYATYTSGAKAADILASNSDIPSQSKRLGLTLSTECVLPSSYASAVCKQKEAACLPSTTSRCYRTSSSRTLRNMLAVTRAAASGAEEGVESKDGAYSDAKA